MDADALGPIEAPLTRARLHIRAGKRRLREGKISLGIITLYDALNHAMQWYVAVPEHRKKISHQECELKDDNAVYEMLVKENVLDNRFDFKAFNDLVEKALKLDMSEYDYSGLVCDIESVMLQIGVMPFDENKLPPERPDTV